MYSGMSMYIYISKYMHTQMYTHFYVPFSIYPYQHIYILLGICLYMYLHTHTHTPIEHCTPIYTLLYSAMSACFCVCVCVYIYISTLTCIPTHTSPRQLRLDNTEFIFALNFSQKFFCI